MNSALTRSVALNLRIPFYFILPPFIKTTFLAYKIDLSHNSVTRSVQDLNDEKARRVQQASEAKNQRRGSFSCPESFKIHPLLQIKKAIAKRRGSTSSNASAAASAAPGKPAGILCLGLTAIVFPHQRLIPSFLCCPPFFSPSLSATPGPAPDIYDVFISLRYEEAAAQGAALKKQLEQQGCSVFLCDFLPGNDLASKIIDALTHCKLVVIMGTLTYGKKTSSGFSTFEELRHVGNEKKELFLVKMCDQFSEPETRFRLPNDMSYYPWQPKSAKEQPPADLCQKILARIQEVGLPRSPTKALSASAHSASSLAGRRVSMSDWLRDHELEELEEALKLLSIDSVPDAIFAVKEGSLTAADLQSLGVKPVRARRFISVSQQ